MPPGAERHNGPLWVCGVEYDLYRIDRLGRAIGADMDFGVDLWKSRNGGRHPVDTILISAWKTGSINLFIYCTVNYPSVNIVNL